MRSDQIRGGTVAAASIRTARGTRRARMVILSMFLSGYGFVPSFAQTASTNPVASPAPGAPVAQSSPATPEAPAASPAASASTAINTAVTRYDNSFEIIMPTIATGGMVASEQALASQAGAQMLRDGGNAVDAAVATGFALAVVLPNAGNLGGGGFMLVHQARTGKDVALDFRETAPASATRDMYLDAAGNVVRGKSTQSPDAVGVPGSVAGLTQALAQFGTMPLAQVIAPAIRLAEEGYRVSPYLSEQFALQRTHMGRWPGTREIFFRHVDGAPPCELRDCPLSALRTYGAGELLVQRDLAASLRAIARDGAPAFYNGEIASKIVAELVSRSHPLTLADLRDYRTVEREPVKGTYRGVQILSMPPPSSGGVHLIQMLNLLERYPMREYGFGSAQAMHLMAEAARSAYADRAQYMGDPDFVKVPARGLVSKQYADKQAAAIDPKRTRASKDVGSGNPIPYESDQTTHFSVMDAAGNVVSCTYTLNLSFGSGIVASGTGILLNNEMDDFSAKPGVANAFGLTGGEANAVAPGKRPLSSMTPVIAMRDGKAWLATGSPGGSRIITIVLQNLVNVIDFEMNIAEAVSQPRLHHQWVPDQLRVERGFSPDTLRLLREMGHDVKVVPTMGRAETVAFDGGVFFGASDPRNPDGAAIGIEIKR